jgi:hypothetical protein
VTCVQIETFKNAKKTEIRPRLDLTFFNRRQSNVRTGNVNAELDCTCFELFNDRRSPISHYTKDPSLLSHNFYVVF